METSRTELEDLGEFGLINHIKSKVSLTNESSVLGIGDDAAIIKQEGKETVVSTDMLIEGIHFDLAYCPLKHLGYKTAVVNFSDIYAMNAEPKQLLISIGMSNRFSVQAIDEFYEGVLLACKKYGVDLIGGDTTASTSGLVVSATVIGSCEIGKNVTRSGAKEDDLLCVTGDLGAAYVGLQILNREKQIFVENPKIQPNLEGYDYIVERQLKPEASKTLITWLKKIKVIPTSMIDISDGLASEVLHICHSSNTGAAIYVDKIPIDYETTRVAEELNLDPVTCALNGGEDYEILFTVPQTDFEKIKDQKGVSIIGHITDKASGGQIITQEGKLIPLQAQGWNAFLNKQFESPHSR